MKVFLFFNLVVSFAGGSFFERDGFPYCREHFYNNSISVCGMCEKVSIPQIESLGFKICVFVWQPVTGECVNAMNKAFHPDCFVCAFCRKAFVDGSFFESGGLKRRKKKKGEKKFFVANRAQENPIASCTITLRPDRCAEDVKR
jgi:hypothetical protein